MSLVGLSVLPRSRPSEMGYRGRLPFSDEERLKALNLYSEGRSLNEVASILGRSPVGVYIILKKERGLIRSNKRVNGLLKRKISRLYFNEGLPAKTIASKLGVAKPTVLYWLNRASSPIPRYEAMIAGSKIVRSPQEREISCRSLAYLTLDGSTTQGSRFASGTLGSPSFGGW